MTRDDIINLALMGERSMKQRIEWAVNMEREECAKLCDVFAVSAFDDEAGIALNIQKSIRARGQV
jgi:hypothetical protein